MNPLKPHSCPACNPADITDKIKHRMDIDFGQPNRGLLKEAREEILRLRAENLKLSKALANLARQIDLLGGEIPK